MDRVCSNLDFEIVYLDDILIFSMLEQAHIKNLRELFKRLKENGLVINVEKINFEAIFRFSQLITIINLEEINRMVNHYVRFITSLASTMTTLCNTDRLKAKHLVLSQEMDVAFNKVKKSNTNAIDHFRYHLDWRSFVASTDHKPLNIVINKASEP
ncbi:hypothetical protein RF11_00345 [Thelohanellus kitauei]|uniref:Reverse transcriptase domain-containing protein n=1 Tax=Thelohanellus kitauei TaxID=669202 RepID=A0A0C2JP64_THEKT|nr:hypothetical protein RF11_00345 [Thelohanellus kitauei]